MYLKVNFKVTIVRLVSCKLVKFKTFPCVVKLFLLILRPKVVKY